MIRWAQPATRFLEDSYLSNPIGQRRGHPDMVQAAAFVGGLPIRRAIAPPCEELCRLRHLHAHGIDPSAGRLRLRELLALDRRVRYDAQHMLVASDGV